MLLESLKVSIRISAHVFKGSDCCGVQVADEAPRVWWLFSVIRVVKMALTKSSNNGEQTSSSLLQAEKTIKLGLWFREN